MRGSPTYYFLSIAVKPIVMTFVSSVMLFTTIFLLKDIPWWIAPVTLSGLHLLYILTRIGTISIRRDDSTKIIVIKTLTRSCVLQAPCAFTAWWSYDFDDDPPQEEDDDKTHTTGSNEINVVLRLTDSQGLAFCFLERIAFDTRFPNEVPYANHGITGCESRQWVQRVDWLMQFLLRNLEETEFYLDGNAHSP